MNDLPLPRLPRRALGAGPWLGPFRQLLWSGLNALQAAYLILSTAFWISISLLLSLITRSPRGALFVARRLWGPGLLLGAGARLEVRGRERLDLGRPAFFVANHQSWIDIPSLFAGLRIPLLFVGKQELARVPFLGWYMAATGMVFVARSARLDAGRSVGLAAERLRQGWAMVSFPEGTRSRDRRMQRWKSAIFAAPIAAGVPVVPVSIHGAGRVLPPDGFRARPGRILVTVGEPIPTAGLAPADRAALARRAERAVQALLDAGPAELR